MTTRSDHHKPYSPIVLSDGRISTKSSFNRISVDRLCGSATGPGTCGLTLLCTQCGVNQTLHMHGVSRDAIGGVPDETSFKHDMTMCTQSGNSHLLMPAVIVLDAVSVIRVSQREAVVEGAGLSGPIRPLQGPVCVKCALSHESFPPPPCALDSTDAATEGVDVSLLSPAESSASVAQVTNLVFAPVQHTNDHDFASRHDELVEKIRNMGVEPSDDVMELSTQCECGTASNSPCGNRITTTISKNSIPSTESLSHTVPFSIVFGHVASPVDSAGAGLTTTSSMVYEIFIVDTRMQRMCSILDERFLRDGVSGQFFYAKPSHACLIPQVVVMATPVVAASSHDSKPPVMATYVSSAAPALQKLIPPPKSSCFVCSGLLDLDESEDSISVSCKFFRSFKPANPLRHTNVYLQSHKNWVHKDCTVLCERAISGVCTKICPRLNTFVSTMFDGSPRFENVCSACEVETNTPAASPNFSSFYNSLAPSSYPILQPYTEPASTFSPRAPEPYQSSNEKLSTNNKKTSVKRNTSKADWLSDAISIRKKAAFNVAQANLSDKQRQEQKNAGAAHEWAQDKSGVYCSSRDSSWYSLDSEGKNPAPVSGLLFFDTYFQDLRVWDSVQQRDRAISSHQSLMEMGKM